MGVVSKRFDHGGHDGIPVDTKTKGNASSFVSAMWSPFFKKGEHISRDEVF